jgi:hypothetical protein
VPTSITLKVLHDIIQAVMGWFDCHLWEFTIGKQKYGLPMDEDWGSRQRFEASKVRLRDVLKRGKTVIDYTYDFGDCWEHRLTVTDIRVPVCPRLRTFSHNSFKCSLVLLAGCGLCGENLLNRPQQSITSGLDHAVGFANHPEAVDLLNEDKYSFSAQRVAH